MANDKLILVSNDDGVDAPGLKTLIDVVKPYGKIIVVAPTIGRSGMSHAITIKDPLRVTKLKEENNVSIYSCNGTPADSIKIALNQICERKPDFIVSGINHGSNSAISVIYSGTMGAAVEGCLNRIPSIGFSLTDHSHDADFSLAQKVAQKVFEKALNTGIPEGTCFNVNIPDIEESNYKGLRVCTMTKGVWKEEFDKRQDISGKDYYWLTGSFENFEYDNKETDEWALRNNYAALVPIKVDLTNHELLDKLKTEGYENGVSRDKQ